MPKRDDKLLLADIIENAENIFEFTRDKSEDEFLTDKMRVLAVVRCFEIIGEASNLISEETKIIHPFVEWRMMADFRNILIHHYFGIDYKVLWQTIQDDLPYNYEIVKRIKL
jgi:uncharacterized protein with HEPN domain